MSYRLGIDIGGTFTDYVLLDDRSGELRLHKRLTTPRDPAEGALFGLEELLQAGGLSLPDCSMVVHGTTLIANAVLERRGARTALLTTRGFRDVLEMGHEQRYDIHDLFLQFPTPLVPRRWRLEVDERMTRDGEPIRRPDCDAVRKQAAWLVERGVEAIAVCLLHAYLKPVHEQMIADLLKGEFPQLALSVSHEVVPEIREYERTSTTVCNAYVQPLIATYVARLERELTLRGFRGRFFLMQSSGGLISPDAACRYPVRLIESGPAGGAMVAAFLGARRGIRDLLAFDMGGTTAKICIVEDGRPTVTGQMEVGRTRRFKRGSGLPIRTPVLDLMEIGAGGGSIAFANRMGLLQVGPQSAGAEPGPACYGRGGGEPTVTDACVRLGYLDPDRFLGGAMRLDAGAAARVLDQLGTVLGLGEGAAWGVYSVVCENMAAAARVHVIEKGRDPRRLPLFAFGGAGPVHATRVARSLGSRVVVVPPLSGVASALGFLVAPATFELGRSLPGELRSLDWDAVARLYGEVERDGAELLRTAAVGPDDIRFERTAEMRLAGQFHDITVKIPAGALDRTAESPIRTAFGAEYERLYRSVPGGIEPLVLNWRLRAYGPSPSPSALALSGSLATGATGRSLRACRPAYFPESGGFVETPVHDRYRLEAADVIEGPAIIEERESTTVVGPGDILEVDRTGNLVISLSQG